MTADDATRLSEDVDVTDKKAVVKFIKAALKERSGRSWSVKVEGWYMTIDTMPRRLTESCAVRGRGLQGTGRAAGFGSRESKPRDL